MAFTLWSQDIFSKGELSPYMYARVSVNEYNNGLKIAQNVLTYPTGAAGKRFGTLYQSTLSSSVTRDNFYFATFVYLNECIYQLVIRPGSIDIYLEGVSIGNVANAFDAYDIANMSTTVIGSIFRIAGPGFKPYDLVRSKGGDDPITGIVNNEFTFTGSTLPLNQPFPMRFVTAGTLPVTTPQIKVGITYFMIATTTVDAVSIFATAYDAKFRLNQFTLTNIGTGSNFLHAINNWTLAHSVFKNLPVYDFNGATTSYDAISFTPSATTGNAVTITLSAAYAPLNSSYIGGAFIGGGGTSRITAVASTTSFTVAVSRPFDATTAIQGSLALLAEPAWSNARGWPQICSSYQNRALFANTASLPNGFYASVINDYTDFGDLTDDDDDAISWYPSSNNINFIRFIVPYRSITVHTNTGIYSSPLSDLAAITPRNFTLQLQDSTPADVLLPQAIDNQVVVISGNDVHQMLWDGINNAYTSNIVSVISEQTVRDPVDEVAFADLRRAGSRYVFIINSNGSMAVFQTLISQAVSGFTPQIMEQSYGDASFRQADSSPDGRCWFVCERQIAQAVSPIAISGFTSDTLTATASNLSTTTPTAITFTTSGTLPASSPQVTTTQYYWAMGVTANTFKVYVDQADALADVSAFTFTSAGTSSNLVAWPLHTIFTLEELTQDTYLDCAVYYNGNPSSTITTGALFNAQNVKMVGDGFGFESTGFNNQVKFSAHGVATQVEEAFIGFPINTIMEPMPLSISNGQSVKNNTLTEPKHIRAVRFMFNNTIGGTINGVPIALKPFNQTNIGEPPFPARGIFEMSIMKGWDDFNNPTYTIEHNEPFNIELLGVFYSVDI